MSRGYQHSFSTLNTAMYQQDIRLLKAETMLHVLRDHFKSEEKLQQLSLLDVGASTGIIDQHLASRLRYVVGIDIDKEAIAHANRLSETTSNLSFIQADALTLPFDDDFFDVVICAQVYEHVPDARQLMHEIFRVLRKGGVCYFAAGNRLAINEPHYNLPFLSVFPRFLAHIYIRISGKARFYYEKHLSYWGLMHLTKAFKRHDYTLKMIESPAQFGISYMITPGSRRQKIASFIAKKFLWLCPGYIWLLEK